MATVNSSNFSDGTAGQVLTSNGPATNPTFQAVSAAGAVVTIKGNDAVAEVPDGSGVFNFLTANSTVKFAGSANTETLDFGLSNLLLGANGASIAGATDNVGVGLTSLTALINGTQNTCVGSGAGASITASNYNTFVGYNAGTAMVGGFGGTLGYNTAVGSQALVSCVNGYENTALGYTALFRTTGIGNIGIGFEAGGVAGAALTGSGNILIGSGARSGNGLTTTDSDNIIIGNAGVSGDNGVIRIGTNGVNNSCFITGIDTVNVGSVAKVVTMASNQLGTATITAGTGVSIVPTANVITVNAVGGGVTWTVETVNLVGAVNHGYIANKAGTLTITLPAASAIGDVIKVTGINTALGWQIQCGAGQQIFVGAGSTTVAGSITSTAIRDSIEIVCVATNLTWNAVNFVGNLTLA